MAPDMTALAGLAAALLASGVVAGVLAGLLGVGGGIVLVPVLFYVFSALGVSPEVKMHMAVGTSLMSMIPTSIRSALAHRRHGAVDEDLLKRWAAPAVVGAVAGILIAAWVKGPVLMSVFAVFASLAALHMAFGKESWRVASQLPGRIGQSVMAFAIACVSVLLGVALIVPATFIAAPWGATLAHRLNRVWLRRAFAVFLGATGVKMALNLLR
jgi:uncharacterized membrane protein YfcA